MLFSNVFESPRSERGYQMVTLTAPHGRALMLLFSELEGTAGEQMEAFLGAPGSIAERANETGTRFWVHRYSGFSGRGSGDCDALTGIEGVFTQPTQNSAKNQRCPHSSDTC